MRIGVIGSDHQGKGASFYRVLVPMQYLSTQGVDIVHIHAPYTPLNLLGLDAIYAHSPVEADYLPLIRLCKDMGIQVWFDYDDHLWAVPEDHPAYEKYINHELMLQILCAADYITCSTPALEEVLFALTQHVIHIQIIRNYLPYDQMQPANRMSKVFAWRGGQSHRLELDNIASQLTNIAEKNELHLWGIASSFIRHPYKWHGRKDPYEYFRSVRHVQPDYFLNYWFDTPFNHCKSDAIALEAAMCGAELIDLTDGAFDDIFGECNVRPYTYHFPDNFLKKRMEDSQDRWKSIALDRVAIGLIYT